MDFRVGESKLNYYGRKPIASTSTTQQLPHPWLVPPLRKIKSVDGNAESGELDQNHSLRWDTKDVGNLHVYDVWQTCGRVRYLGTGEPS